MLRRRQQKRSLETSQRCALLPALEPAIWFPAGFWAGAEHVDRISAGPISPPFAVAIHLGGGHLRGSMAARGEWSLVTFGLSPACDQRLPERGRQTL